MTRVVTATFRVVTPLFLGGADPAKDCELRTASIKGALLFWWRALRGAELPVPELRREEQALFGSSEGGQSKWLLDARGDRLGRGFVKLELDEGRGYLAGQGLAQLRQDPQQHLGHPHRPFARDGAVPAPKPFENRRPYLRPGGRIALRAFRRVPSPGADAEAESLCKALAALATFGGLGSRSRRGFGSLHLEHLACDGEDRSWEDCKTRVSGLLDKVSYSALPEFTHFSDKSRILVLEAHASAEDFHEELGRRFKSFRSHERTGGVGENDHNDIAAWLGSGAISAPPRRAVFGLPHNYYFSSTGTKVGVEPAGKSNRRASPLFLHVDETGDETDRHAVAVLTFLPAAFLPPRTQVQLKGDRRSARLSPRAMPGLWQPIHDWLDELAREPPLGADVWEKP